MASPLLDDPVRSLRVLAGGALAGVPVDSIQPKDRAALERALDEYVAVQRFNADQPSAWVNLGDVYGARGEAQRAEESYRTALEMDPAWIPAYVNYADWLRRANRDGDGESILRAGLARRPNDASLRHSLGLLLVRRKDMPAALAELGRAAALAPDNPRFAYVYAVALQSTGKRREALAVAESALAERARRPRSSASFAPSLPGRRSNVEDGDKGRMTSSRRVLAALLALLVGGLLFVYVRSAPGSRPARPPAALPRSAGSSCGGT